MTDLADSVESMKRAVATPGTFASTYPDTTDDDIVGLMEDGLAEAQLDGFLQTFTVDIDAGTVTPDLSQAQLALISIYASARMIRSEILNRQNKQRYKAGPVEYETEQSSNVLAELLKELQKRKDDILQRLYLFGATKAFEMADQYFIKAVGPYPGTDSLYYGTDADRAYDYNSPYGF